MRLLDREILRCEGKIPQFAPSAQLRGKLLYNVSLRAIESSECFGDSEGARLGKVQFRFVDSNAIDRSICLGVAKRYFQLDAPRYSFDWLQNLGDPGRRGRGARGT